MSLLLECFPALCHFCTTPLATIELKTAFFPLILRHRKHFSSSRSLDSTVCLPQCCSSATDFLDFYSLRADCASKSSLFLPKTTRLNRLLSFSRPCDRAALSLHQPVSPSAISDRRYVAGGRRDGGGRLLLLQPLPLLSATSSPDRLSPSAATASLPVSISPLMDRHTTHC